MTKAPKIHLALPGYAVLCATKASAHIAPQFAVKSAAEFRRLAAEDPNHEMCARCATTLAKIEGRRKP